MNKLKKFTNQYPLIISIIFLVFSIIFTEIDLTPFFKKYVDYQSSSYMSGIIEQGLCSLIIALLITGIGLSKKAGFTKPKEWKQLWITWPIVILTVLNGWSFFDGSLIIDASKPMIIILFILVYLSTGFFEEILCRGFITTVMLQKWGSTKRGIYLAVITSSLIFGLIHILNFIMGRSSLISVLTQITYATFFGVFFSACILRNNAIWPTIILHAIFDMSGNLSSISIESSFGQIRETTLTDALSTIIVTLPLLIYGLFLIRKIEVNNNRINEIR